MRAWITVPAALALLGLALLGHGAVARHIALLLGAGEVASLCAAEVFFLAASQQVSAGRRRECAIVPCGLVLLGAAAVMLAEMLLIGGVTYGFITVLLYSALRLCVEYMTLNGAKVRAAFTGIAAGCGLLLPWLLGDISVANVPDPLLLSNGILGGLTVIAAVLSVLGEGREKTGTVVRTGGVLRHTGGALVSRAAYLLPAIAVLLTGPDRTAGYAAGLAVFSLLRTPYAVKDGERERFPVRWVWGMLLTTCTLAGFVLPGGEWLPAFAALGTVAALLPVKHDGRCAVSALLCAASGALGWAGIRFGALTGLPQAAVIAAAAAGMLLLCAAAAWVQKGAIYAWLLPKRARLIRRRAIR